MTNLRPFPSSLRSTCLMVLCGLSLGLSAQPVSGAERPYMVLEVTGQRVNLRARPELEAEVVGQVEEGELLYAKSLGLQWAEIAPPEGLFVWVHRDHVEEGRVTASKLNLRAGPGVNYSAVGEILRGVRVQALETFGEWLRIAPPPSVSFWVSREFLRELEPLGATPVTILELPSIPQPPAVIEPAEAGPVVGPGGAITEKVEHASLEGAGAPVPPPPAFAPPSDLDLIPLAGQGRQTRVQGRLRRTGFGFGRPSGFRLVGVDESGQTATLCHLRGNTEQLRTMLNREMLVVGREYWVRDSAIPVVIPERIILPGD